MSQGRSAGVAAAGAGGGNVVTDAIWQAADDLAVGTGVGAAARLAVPPSSIVAKLAAGGLKAATPAEIKTLLAIAATSVSVDPAPLAIVNSIQGQGALAELDAALATAQTDIAGKSDTAHVHTTFIKTTGGGEDGQRVASITGAHTIDLSLGNSQVLTMTGNVTFTFPAVAASKYCSFRLKVIQDATGGRVITWPGSVVWVTGAPPVISTTLSTSAILFFETENGGTSWLGYHVTAPVLAQVCPFIAGTADAWTDMPAALTEYDGSTTRRLRLDLTHARQVRIVCTMTVLGTAGAEYRVQYSTDESTWAYLDGASGPGVTIDALGVRTGGWVDLVAAAKADVFLRVVGIGGSGTADPTVNQMSLHYR